MNQSFLHLEYHAEHIVRLIKCNPDECERANGCIETLRKNRYRKMALTSSGIKDAVKIHGR